MIYVSWRLGLFPRKKEKEKGLDCWDVRQLQASVLHASPQSHEHLVEVSLALSEVKEGYPNADATKSSLKLTLASFKAETLAYPSPQ